jgi:putative DNA primase/helicase
MRMDADLDRIHFIEEAIPPGAKSRPFNPATDMPALVEKAKAIGDVALLILDPVVAAVPMTRNSHNNAESRNGMQPVIDFAKASDIAVLGIGHLTKGTVGKDPLERINGSGAFGALPRLVMGAAKNEAEGDDKPERIMVRIKSNIGPSDGGFGYHIDTATLVESPARGDANRLGIAA